MDLCVSFKALWDCCVSGGEPALLLQLEGLKQKSSVNIADIFWLKLAFSSSFYS